MVTAIALPVLSYRQANKNEPPHKITNKMAFAPSGDSDQPGHPPSLIRVFAGAHWVAKDPSFLHADSKDTDQTGQMPRLIWVFAGGTYHFVGFVVRRLNLVCYTFVTSVSTANMDAKILPQQCLRKWHKLCISHTFLISVCLNSIRHSTKMFFDSLLSSV